MCGVTKVLNSKTSTTPSSMQESESPAKTMDNSIGGVETEYSFSVLLELAADDNVDGFNHRLSDPSSINKIGLWYGRQTISRKMVIEPRTPLMIAAKFGSVEIVKLILSFPEVDVNLSCGPDKSTALHCAASGGSSNSINVAKLLLNAGADPNINDAHGNRPVDVIVGCSLLPGLKIILEEILKNTCEENLHASSSSLGSSFRSLSSSPDNGFSSLSSDSLLSTTKPNGMDASLVPEKKEYPVDPSLPDIKSGIYSTDDFRMYSFKIRPCSRAYSHDWTECPFAHPGENARRRDPRKFHYTCVPCPDFKKGTCKRGDMCEYAHGVFESWLHPGQYRTRLCKDETSCNRRVCFFAHTNEELRPLYASTGSGVPSPRAQTVSAPAMDMAAVLNILPGSPSTGSLPFTLPMSPSGNVISHSSMGWPQLNIPSLHLPGSNLQTSRLKSSLNARDIPAEELSMLQALSSPRLGMPLLNLSARSKSLNPSNLDDLFSAEVASPRYSDQPNVSSVLSPSHKSAILNQLQHKQAMLSPIKTNLLSPRNVDHPLLQASFGVSSPGKMSPRTVEPISPMSSRLSNLTLRDKQQQQLHTLGSCDLGSNLSRDLDVGSPVSPWSKWEFHKGVNKVDWSVQSDELGRFCKSHSMANQSKEADVSWVQPLLKDNGATTPRSSSGPAAHEGSNQNPNGEICENDILDAWLDQLQLDRIVS